MKIKIIKLVDDLIEKKTKELKINLGLDIKEWWSSEIFTGLEIEKLKKDIEKLEEGQGK